MTDSPDARSPGPERTTGTEPHTEPQTHTGRGDLPPAAGSAPPRTGDLLLDAALDRLAGTHTDDLDGRLAAGGDVQRTLQARLGDLGG